MLSFFGSHLRVDADQGGGVVYFVYSLLLQELSAGLVTTLTRGMDICVL